MNTISVVFSRPKKWKPFAQSIMWAFNIPFDHVSIKVHVAKYQRDLVYQASGLAVNFMSPDIFNANNIVVKTFDFQISDQAKVKLMQYAIDRAGVPYGLKEILGLAIVRIAYWLGKTIKNPFSDGDATYVCCELVGQILEEFANLKLDMAQDDIDPLYLYNLLGTITQTNTST